VKVAIGNPFLAHLPGRFAALARGEVFDDVIVFGFHGEGREESNGMNPTRTRHNYLTLMGLHSTFCRFYDAPTTSPDPFMDARPVRRAYGIPHTRHGATPPRKV